MLSGTYPRLFGQMASLAVHTGNCIALVSAMQDEELMKDPQIKTMTSLQMQYLTVWNILFQMAYFSVAFVCDFFTLTGRHHMISKSIRQFRHTFFSSIIWPTASLISIVFWIVFAINRELLYPAFIDKIFSFNNNLVMHFFIAPAALWELLFLPRTTPKSHTRNIGLMSAINVLYIGNIIYTYSQRGIWPYPILNMVSGTSFFIPFFAGVLLIETGFYYAQWILTAKVWASHQKEVNAFKRE